MVITTATTEALMNLTDSERVRSAESRSLRKPSATAHRLRSLRGMVAAQLLLDTLLLGRAFQPQYHQLGRWIFQQPVERQMLA